MYSSSISANAMSVPLQEHQEASRQVSLGIRELPRKESKLFLLKETVVGKLSSVNDFFARMRYHLPARDSRVPPRHFFAYKAKKYFLHTAMGEKLQKIIKGYHDFGLFECEAPIQKYVQDQLKKEGTHSGEAMAELVCSFKKDVSEEEKGNLISFFAACEKLKQCAERLEQSCENNKAATEESVLATLSAQRALFDAHERECRRKVVGYNLTSLADCVEKMTQLFRDDATALQNMDQKVGETRVKCHSLYRELAIACDSICFPQNVECIPCEPFSKEEICSKVTMPYSEYDGRLLLRFLIVTNKTKRAHTVLSACIEEGKSFIFMPRKGRYQIGAKASCFDELKLTLETYCGSNDKIELTVWKQPISEQERVAASSSEAERPSIMELEIPTVAAPSAPELTDVLPTAPPAPLPPAVMLYPDPLPYGTLPYVAHPIFAQAPFFCC